MSLMARKRDILIAIIIIVSVVFTIGFFGLVFLGTYYADDGMGLGGFGDKVAVIEIFGGIYNSESIVRQLKKWGGSGSVKAILLHIDSPGGAVAPSQEIYTEILRVRDEEGKIIVAAMSSVAASGGYLIACAADRVMANPGTLTGSIGVILQYPTAGELLDKIGIKYERVKSGELKDVGSIDRDMSEEEREMLSALVMDTYEQFVDVVVEGRELSRDEVYPLADGSIFSGRQARELGLVDTLGSFEEAVRMAADMAGLSGDPNIIKEYRPQKGLWDLLGSFLGQSQDVVPFGNCGPRIMYLY